MHKLNPHVKPLALETLLTMLENSVGTKMFQTIWAEVDGEKKDITEQGNLSCAFYVSGVLAMFGLIDRIHSTVSGTVLEMEKYGWQKTKVLKPGVVMVWNPGENSQFTNQHIGFYLGQEQAISNSWQKGVIAKHHYTFGKVGSKEYRPIVAMYRHPKLK